VCTTGVLLLGAAPSAWAGGSEHVAAEGGLGMAAAISSLIYGPTKTVYALGGTVIAGCAWVFTGGDTRVASTVITRSVRGTYVITPETLKGRQELEFVGRAPEYRSQPGAVGEQVAAAPEAW